MHANTWEYPENVLTCIWNAWTYFVNILCVFLVSGPIQKDAHRKAVCKNGRMLSRSLTVTSFMTKQLVPRACCLCRSQGSQGTLNKHKDKTGQGSEVRAKTVRVP